MENILNITNGDSAVKVMREADFPGVFLPWRDVLHDGPVPPDLSLEKLSEIRAQFITDQGWGDPEAIRNSFIERDKKLQSFLFPTVYLSCTIQTDLSVFDIFFDGFP